MTMKLKGFLVLLAVLNLLVLCYYIVHFPTSNENFLHRAPLARREVFPGSNPARGKNDKRRSSSFDGKLWPDLPSYMPWRSDVKAKASSCEAYFGNGFNKIYDPLDNSPNRKNIDINLSGSSFKCYYSETLETSICEGRRMAMFPERIEMSRGGEDVEAVLGREEEAELPKYSDGAFQIEAPPNYVIGDGRVVSGELLDQIMPQGAVHTHTMRSLLQTLRVVPSSEFVCNQWIEEPTLLLTRFEYANLFHTYTDWYSAYVTSRVAGLPKRPHLIFVDGHCK
ncbi:hypothetical protein KI387_009508, partial [Taxus chinensis]